MRHNTTYTLRKICEQYEPCGCHIVKDIRKPVDLSEYEPIEYYYAKSQNGRYHNKGYDIYEYVNFSVCPGHGNKLIKDCKHGELAKPTPLYESKSFIYDVLFHGDIKQDLMYHERKFSGWGCNRCIEEKPKLIIHPIE